MEDDESDVRPEVDDLNATLLQHVRRVYQKYGENMTRAAQALNVTRSTLRKYLAEK